ncbi:MAG: hypothetical protein GY763_01280, partial [Gammaproteobacteria bacterium]|nr:hypothetical protein [Gammaproteobacteria bacterium]
YSNIEKRCFSDGVLTCIEFHPIWKGGLSSSTEQHRNHADIEAISADGAR